MTLPPQRPQQLPPLPQQSPLWACMPGPRRSILCWMQGESQTRRRGGMAASCGWAVLSIGWSSTRPFATGWRCMRAPLWASRWCQRRRWVGVCSGAAGGAAGKGL